jgi:hypothetical protein
MWDTSGSTPVSSIAPYSNPESSVTKARSGESGRAAQWSMAIAPQLCPIAPSQSASANGNSRA